MKKGGVPRLGVAERIALGMLLGCLVAFAPSMVLAIMEVRVSAIGSFLVLLAGLMITGALFYSVARRMLGPMKQELREQASALTKAAEAEARLKGELRIASDIQRGLLPKLERINAGDSRIEVAGMLKPAQSVGGDLYNAFFVDRNHLCVCMGDVSGKGISAALFMAVVQTLIRALARYDASPAAVLAKVNQDRAGSNDSCMFVTLFCAVIDMRSGTMAYCNGGHNPPVFMENTGAAGFLPSKDGTLVGLAPDVQYHDEYRVLKPGDTIYFYTDGVTEAFPEEGGMYGEERLVKFLNGMAGKNCQEIVEAVRDDVAAFVKGAPQSDDIAMLVVRYKGDAK